MTTLKRFRNSRYLVSPEGAIFSEIRNRYLKPHQRKNGYQQISLMIDGAVYREYVHRIVAEVFLGPPPSPQHEIAHNDGNPKNNCLLNLRWATKKQNQNDRIAHNTVQRGETHHNAKLTAALVNEIRSKSNSVSGRTLSKMFGITYYTISDIIRRKTWRHV